MKCLWKKVICGALVAGMLAQCPQSIYAEDAANTATVTDTESNHVTPDTTQQPDDTKQPDDTQQPGDIQQPDDIQQPEELPQPSAVEGLHTTKQVCRWPFSSMNMTLHCSIPGRLRYTKNVRQYTETYLSFSNLWTNSKTLSL